MNFTILCLVVNILKNDVLLIYGIVFKNMFAKKII